MGINCYFWFFFPWKYTGQCSNIIPLWKWESSFSLEIVPLPVSVLGNQKRGPYKLKPENNIYLKNASWGRNSVISRLLIHKRCWMEIIVAASCGRLKRSANIRVTSTRSSKLTKLLVISRWEKIHHLFAKVLLKLHVAFPVQASVLPISPIPALSSILELAIRLALLRRCWCSSKTSL